MRIAIISTPRSGNTWLKRMLVSSCNGAELATHYPYEIDWASLPPENVILQFHWGRTSKLELLLEEHGFKVVVLQRHPLDVLISILQFARHEPQTAFWLAGDGGNEEAIHTASPLDSAFLEYAMSQRAKQLLSVSLQWSEWRDSHVVKYEDLVKDVDKVFGELVQKLRLQTENVDMAIQVNNIAALRKTSTNNHFWQGKPNIWQKLIPIEYAKNIENFHQELFINSGYSAKSNHDLSPLQAQTNWEALCQ